MLNRDNVTKLVYFEGVSLQPKNQKVLKIQLPLNASLSTFGIPPGAYEIQVGSSCKDIRMVYPFQIHTSHGSSRIPYRILSGIRSGKWKDAYG